MSYGIKIFSYLPNPRVWKSLIAANLCGAEVEVVGDEPKNLPNWLWDYDARELLKNALDKGVNFFDTSDT